MECPQVSEQLRDCFGDFMDEATRAALRTHWEKCESCRQEARSLLDVWEKLDLVSVPPGSGDPRSRFDAMLASYRQGQADAKSVVLRDWLSGGWWPRQALAQALGALLFLLTGLVVGWQSGDGGQTLGLEALEGEVRNLRQLVALSMLEQRSASQRLRGVSWTAQMDEPDAEVIASLLDTLDSDSSVNVRLAVVDVLGHFGDDPRVRGHVLASLPRQQSPFVQVSMINLLVEMRERRSVPLFEQLAGSESVHEAVRDRALWGLSELS